MGKRKVWRMLALSLLKTSVLPQSSALPPLLGWGPLLGEPPPPSLLLLLHGLPTLWAQGPSPSYLLKGLCCSSPTLGLSSPSCWRCSTFTSFPSQTQETNKPSLMSPFSSHLRIFSLLPSPPHSPPQSDFAPTLYNETAFAKITCDLLVNKLGGVYFFSHLSWLQESI